MPQVEADLIIEVGKTQQNLKNTILLQTTIDENNKKIATNSSASFKKVANDIDSANKNIQQGIGFLTNLRQKIEDLKARRELAATAEQAAQFTREIRSSELEIRKLEGTVQATGERVKLGVAGVTQEFLSLGQGIVGAINLFSLLGSEGDKENQALIKATRLLVIAESARQLILGAIQSKEFILLGIEKLRTAFSTQKIAATVKETVAISAEAEAYLVLAGAQEASTVATDAQTAAMEAYITEQEAAKAATVGTTEATTALNASLLENPYVLIAAGIVAVIAALVIFGDTSERVSQEQLDFFDKQTEAANKINQARLAALDAQLKYLQSIGKITSAQADQVQEEQTFEQQHVTILRDKHRKLLQLQKDYQDKSTGDVKAFFLDLITSTKAGTAQQIVEQSKLTGQRKLILDAANAEEKALLEKHNEDLKTIQVHLHEEQLQREHTLSNLRNALILNDLEKQIADRKEKAQEEIDSIKQSDDLRSEKIKLIEAKLQQDLLQIRDDGTKKLRDQLLAEADAEDAIRKRVLDAQKQFNTNTENLAIDLARALKDNDRSLLAAQDAAEARVRTDLKGKDLLEIDTAVASARLAVANEFEKIKNLIIRAGGEAQLANEREQARAQILLGQDTFAKRLSDVADFNDKEAIRLQKLGIDQEIIERAANQRILEAAVKFNEDKIALEGKTAKDLINSRIRTNESEVSFEERKKIDLLRIDKEIAEARVALAENDITQSLALGLEITPEQRSKLAAAQAEVQGFTKQINETLKTIEPISWARILGISGADAKSFNDSFNGLMAGIIETLKSGTEAAIAENDKLIEASKALIGSMSDVTASLSDQIKTAEQELEEQLKLQREGYASNVTAKQQEIAALKAERDKEIIHLQSLLEKKKKLAKEQLTIESIQQGSAIALASANIILNWTKTGTVLSIFAAIAEIATMIAFFSSIKSKQRSIESEGFYEGGYTGDGTATDVAGVTHKKEFVFDHKKTTEYRELFEKIHKDQPLTTKDLLPLLEGTGVVIPEAAKQEISQANTELVEHKSQPGISLNEINKQLGELNEKVAEVQKRMDDSIESWQEPGGITVLRQVKRGSEKIKRIKPNG